MERINKKYLNKIKPIYKSIPKWVIFAETMLSNGWKVYLVENKNIIGKHIYTQKRKKEYKIRFDNHSIHFENKQIITIQELMEELRGKK